MSVKNIKSIIAISSCKGGVGKSTVAAHLATELARRGLKVGLLDADIYGPSVPTLFNLPQVTLQTTEDNQIIPIEKNNLKIMSFGFLLGDAPAVMRGPIVTRYIQQLLLNTQWGELDYLLIDMPPGTGDIQLTITQSLRLTGAVIVTTRQNLSLVDVARGILMFERVNVPILGVIENMSYFLCDKCQEKHFIFGGEKNSSLKERFGVTILAEIPLLPQLTLNVDEAAQNQSVKNMTDKVLFALEQNSTPKQIPQIKFDEKNITLSWPDGSQWTVNNRALRLKCRCALCINEVTGKKILREEKIRPDIAPKEAFPLGNYAVGINWNDRHSSGIYSYELIKELVF